MLPFDRMMGSSGGDIAFASGDPLGLDIIDEESSGSEEGIQDEEFAMPELQHTQSEFNTLKPARVNPVPLSTDTILDKLSSKQLKEEELKVPQHKVSKLLSEKV
jgi:hypothetical protein